MNSIQSYNRYSDALVLQRKRSVLKRLALFVFISFIVAVLTGYLLFFTPYLQITDVSISGLRTIAPEEVRSLIDSVPIGGQAVTFQNIFSVFKFINIQKQKNIIFFDIDIAQDKILAQFPVIKSVEIRKDYPHKLTFDLIERNPIGTWCFAPTPERELLDPSASGGDSRLAGEDADGSTLLTTSICSYFDGEGVLWGKALKSSGPLLLTVEDKRGDINTSDKIEPNLLESINKIIAGFDDMGIGIKKMEIPAGSLNDLMVHTAEGYYVLADSSSNIDKQLNTLSIFLKNKDEDLHPEYIDIRLEGRVYYK